MALDSKGMLLPSKIVCVGRNYAAHAKELGNAVPEAPILFIKPPSSVRYVSEGIVLPKDVGACHYETELCVKIGGRQPLKNATSEHAQAAISGVTLGLDLTLRDLQNDLKQKGYPWERAKAFDGACILADWLEPQLLPTLNQLSFTLSIDGVMKQQGQAQDMLFNIVTLIAHISQTFSLMPGDVVMTGTPAGVGSLQAGQQLTLTLATLAEPVSWQTQVIELT